MGRKPKPKRYSLVVASAVCCVGEDRVFDPNVDPEKGLMDQLQCPVADEVLIGLRKSFSLTYPTNPFMDGLQAAIAEIRRIGADALKPMPEVLRDLGLPSLPPVMDDHSLDKPRVFMFLFARTDDIDITVKFEGKKRRLLDLAQHEDGTALVTTLRSVVSDTFQEAHDEDQHSTILQGIRKKIHAVLPPFNICLEAIEVEPIAERPLSEPMYDEDDDDSAE